MKKRIVLPLLLLLPIVLVGVLIMVKRKGTSGGEAFPVRETGGVHPDGLPVGPVAFSPDGARLAAVVRDKYESRGMEDTFDVVEWSLPGGEELVRWKANGQCVAKLEWSPDGGFVQNSGRWVQRFDANSGKELTPALQLAIPSAMGTMAPIGRPNLTPPGEGRPPVGGPNMLPPGAGGPGMGGPPRAFGSSGEGFGARPLPDLAVMKSVLSPSGKVGLVTDSFRMRTFEVDDRTKQGPLNKMSRISQMPDFLLAVPGSEPKFVLFLQRSSDPMALHLLCIQSGVKRPLWTLKWDNQKYGLLDHPVFSGSGRYLVNVGSYYGPEKQVKVTDQMTHLPKILKYQENQAKHATVVDASTGKVISSFMVSKDYPTAWAIQDGGDVLVAEPREISGAANPSWSGAYGLTFWDLASGKIIESLHLPSEQGEPRFLAFSANGKRVALSEPRGLRVWNLAELRDPVKKPQSLYVADAVVVGH